MLFQADRGLILTMLAILGGIGIESSLPVQAKTDNYQNRQSPISQLRLAISTNTPNIAKNTTRLIFNDVQGGAASAAQTVTLRNTGNAKLTISSLKLSGAQANQFQITQKPTLPLTVAAGSVATVSIAFKPTTQGPKGGLLQLQSNDPDTSGNAASKRQIFTVPNASYQSLKPSVSGKLSFDPGTGSFGFYSSWPFFNNRTLYSEDRLNTFTGAIPHHVRVYPLKNANGTVVPNAYVVATEENTSGFDYQDIVVIVRNVKRP